MLPLLVSGLRATTASGQSGRLRHHVAGGDLRNDEPRVVIESLKAVREADGWERWFGGGHMRTQRKEIKLINIEIECWRLALRPSRLFKMDLMEYEDVHKRMPVDGLVATRAVRLDYLQISNAYDLSLCSLLRLLYQVLLLNWCVRRRHVHLR